jgi:hypothetical protein
MAGRRLVIRTAASAGVGPLTHTLEGLSAEQVEEALAKLGDANGVLRFKTMRGARGAYSEMLIPVRAVVDVSVDVDP